MKRKLMGILVVVLALFLVTGCGEDKTDGGKTDVKDTMKSEHIKVDGVYIDESFEDPNLSLVYLFYTLDASEENLETSSKSMKMMVNGKNEYDSTVLKDFIPKYTDYYYSDFIEKIYVGNTFKMSSTFKVAKGDLKDSKKITLINSSISSIDKIEFTTDDIKTMSDIGEISKDLDKAVYDKRFNDEQSKMAAADATEVTKFQTAVNGYMWEFYVTVGTQLAKYEIEFSAPNTFVVSNSYGLSNSGTYDVRKGAVILNYNTGLSNTIYYDYSSGDVTFLNMSEAFSTYVEYNPLEVKE